jgi:hypothetical protein
MCDKSSFAVPTSFSRNDAFPVYTTLDPYTFLYKRERFIDKDGIERQRYCPQAMYLSLSPFGQNANFSRDECKNCLPLGDITGRWNMLGLLYGCTPSGSTLPPVLLEAQQGLYPTFIPPICDQAQDPCQKFGYFSVDTAYRKRGFRWELDLHIAGDVCLSIQGGVADICNTVSCISNLTDCSSFGCTDVTTGCCNPSLTKENVNHYLMDKFDIIADQLCLDTSSYHLTTLEDLRFNLYWRHAYEGNTIINHWPSLYVMPFLMLSGVVAVGKDPKANQMFGISSGSNGHHSISGSGGLQLDFVETVDLGFEIGATHYFPRDVCCYRMPNSPLQSTIFPFTTDVNFSPGWNWHFCAKLGAYQFIEHLSFYFQYVLIHHQEDKVCPKCYDPCFVPEVIAERSAFRTQLANMSLDYDISPHLSLGVLWQAPLAQLYSFRSSTILLSLNVFY